MLVSLCDKVHNAEAISNDKLRFGDAVYERFNKEKMELFGTSLL